MSQDNVNLVKKLYEAFGTRDRDAILQLVSPEVVAAQSEEVPWGGEYRGLDGLERFFTNLFSHIQSKLVFEQFLDAGDHVVAIGRTQGNVVATGAPFDVPIAHVWQVRDGKVVRFNPYIDIPTMRDALAAKL